jgi:hypothetical protein
MTINVRPQTGKVVSAAPVVTAGAYSANDAVGGLMTFADAVRRDGGSGIIRSLTLTDLTVTANLLRLWLFDAQPAAIADNAAFDLADADLVKVVGVIPIIATDYFVATDNQAACIRNVGLEFSIPVGTTLYGQLMCTETPTYVSTADLTLTMGIEYLD